MYYSLDQLLTVAFLGVLAAELSFFLAALIVQRTTHAQHMKVLRATLNLV